MKSKYYVVYYRDFANTYYLVSATADTEHLLPKDAERITRKEAIRMCRAELERQKYDRAFSGYASTEVWPIEAYLSLEHLQVEGLTDSARLTAYLTSCRTTYGLNTRYSQPARPTEKDAGGSSIAPHEASYSGVKSSRDRDSNKPKHGHAIF